MLAGFLLLLYSIAFTWLAGAILFVYLAPESQEQHPSITILSGLVLIALLLQPLHLFLAMNEWAHGVLFLFVIPMGMARRNQLGALLKQQTSKWLNHPFNWVFIPLLFLVALLNLIGRAGIGDIADYHLQAIQWDANFLVVKGLGNLRRQLGNNSSWFLLHAFFGLNFLHLKSVYILNVLLLIVGCFYFLPHPDKKYPWLHSMILIYIAMMAFRKYVGSVTNDYAITIFTLIIFSEWINAEKDNAFSKWIAMLMTLMLPTFKLSALAMGLMVAWYLWNNIKSSMHRKYVMLTLLAACVIFIPWFITNYFQSGYLIYPLEHTAIGSPDWQMRISTLEYERIINIANERVPGMATTEVMQLNFTAWFPKWLSALDPLSKLLLVLFFLLPILILVRMRSNASFKSFVLQQWHQQQCNAILLAMIVAIPLWFFNAPSTRFVFGYLVFTMAWCMQLLMGEKYITLISSPGNLILILGINLFFFVKLNLPKEKIVAALIEPPRYGNNPIHPVELKTGFVYTPDSLQQCWDAPIPCTSIIDSSLRWRTEELKDGFSIKAMPLKVK